MGLTISYYVVNEKAFEILRNPSIDVTDFIHNEILFSHDYKGLPFWRNGTEFGEGVKAWNPMIELICLLDNKQDSILRSILSVKNLIPENENNGDYKIYCLNNHLVNSIWMELKKMSVERIENSLKIIELIEKIKNTKGYNMQYISSKELIIMEFMELFKCVFTAFSRKKGILAIIS